MDKYVMWLHYERLHNHNKAKHNKTVCIFLGIYCIYICPNFDCPIANPSNTFMRGLVIISHRQRWMWLLTHAILSILLIKWNVRHMAGIATTYPKFYWSALATSKVWVLGLISWISVPSHTVSGRRGKQDSGFCLLLCFTFTKIKYLCAGEVEKIHSNILFPYGIWVSFNLIFTIYAFLDILFCIEHSPESISSRQRNKCRSFLNTNMGKMTFGHCIIA